MQEVKNRLTNKDDRSKISNEMMRPSGDASGLISAAKEGLNRASKPEVPREPQSLVLEAEKKTESDMQWERIQRRLKRQLKIKDMDFTDLKEEEDEDVFCTPNRNLDISAGILDGLPPPPPPGMPGPPLLPGMVGPPPPPPLGNLPPPPPPLGQVTSTSTAVLCNLPPPPGSNLPKKKKTVKLHWRTLQNVEAPHPTLKGETIWKELVPVTIDAEKLEHLFENRTNEVKTKVRS